jgi:hypothetical protein
LCPRASGAADRIRDIKLPPLLVDIENAMNRCVNRSIAVNFSNQDSRPVCHRVTVVLCSAFDLTAKIADGTVACAMNRTIVAFPERTRVVVSARQLRSAATKTIPTIRTAVDVRAMVPLLTIRARAGRETAP